MKPSEILENVQSMASLCFAPSGCLLPSGMLGGPRGNPAFAGSREASFPHRLSKGPDAGETKIRLCFPLLSFSGNYTHSKA